MTDRITLSRAKGWKKPANSIVVSRPSIFGNPWIAGEPGRLHLRGINTIYRVRDVMTTEEAVTTYRVWLQNSDCPIRFLPSPSLFTALGRKSLWDALDARRATILAALPTLRGHDLCCWCKLGEPCHADVLLAMADTISGALADEVGG
jgi:hypothetical protein